MKKQLLIAAVAASMTSVAMADISISGSAKANVNQGAASIEADLNVTGKSGATSVVANISLDKGIAASATSIVEDLYMTSSFEGVNIKVGSYRSGKSELDVTSAASNRYDLSTTVSGVTVAFEETATANSITVGGEIAGVSVKHKMKSGASSDTETWVSASMSGVNLTWNQEDNSDKKDTFMSVSTELSGVTATYAKIDSDATTVADGFFKGATIKKATGFSLATSVAGNKITLKTTDTDNVKVNKIIATRVLASGATFEATYADNAGTTKDTLDLELAVKF
jgi:hypothetical protein